MQTADGETAMSYYCSKMLDLPFDQALARVQDELQREGFGVLTEIDVKETLKKKLDVDFKRYRILGACSPQFAHQALKLENKIGLMLPCNVVVQERGENGTEVAVIDPVSSMQAVGNERLQGIARQVRRKLNAVVSRL